MLVISDQTYSGLQDAALESWIKKVVPQVQAARPDWAAKVGVDGVVRTCRLIEAFSRAFTIEKMDNFWLLLDALIFDPGALDSLNPYQDFVLRRESFSEDLRVGRFVREVLDGKRTRMVDLV
ncbi:hypothetical protein [Novosphingobium sp.]|uniref:hypothetical protein n=1 Tax=Novosphingobium sp. TaxID=1874826 RepID=UPI00286DABC3|nr:hypothetical protein [Novosphingobium sp.]